jgi:hypothetical protein
MAPRLELQTLFEGITGNGNVYFQPPPDFKMQYPCIVYQKDFLLSDWADGIPYRQGDRYQVTTIDRDPDSDLPQKIRNLPMCVYDRFFTAKNLNHHVFKLFF